MILQKDKWYTNYYNFDGIELFVRWQLDMNDKQKIGNFIDY